MCHWDAERGFDHGITVPGLERTDASYCTVTFVTNMRRTGLFITSQAREVWVPTPTKPHAYTYGSGAVFVAVDHESSYDEVHVVRWEQGASEPTWRHVVDPEDAWQLDLSLDAGVLVVSWGAMNGRHRTMLDARTGDVLQQETLPERVRHAVENFEAAFTRSKDEGRLCSDAYDVRHLNRTDCELLRSMGQELRPSKERSRGMAYERLGDGTTIVLDDLGDRIAWVEEDSKRVLGEWRTRHRGSGFWH